MTRKERLREIILQLKQIKGERELSCGEIHKMIKASGEDISLATVKRVFSDGSEEQGFRYNDTIRPIVQVLLSVKEETPLNDTEVDTLKNVVLLKEAMIAELEGKAAKLQEKLDESEVWKTDHKQTLLILIEEVAFLKEQIRNKDKYIEILVQAMNVKEER